MIKLKEIRKEKEMTQRELADKVGVSVQTISGYETGYSQPPLEILIKIADILEASLDYLTGRSDDIGNIEIKTELSNIESKIVSLLTSLSYDKQCQVLGFVQALAK